MSDTRLDLVRCEDWEGALLADMRTSGSRVATRFQAYRREIAKCYAEIDQLKADRDEWKRDAGKLAESSVKAACVTRTRETIDGVECERIRGLDVVVPAGLIQDGEEMSEVRSTDLPYSTRWIDVDGEVLDETDGRSGMGCDLRILLADKPYTSPAPTWTPPASLPDGPYQWGVDRGRMVLTKMRDGDVSWADWSPPDSYKDWTAPSRYGTWQVESGCATYLGPNQESPQ